MLTHEAIEELIARIDDAAALGESETLREIAWAVKDVPGRAAKAAHRAALMRAHAVSARRDGHIDQALSLEDASERALGDALADASPRGGARC